MEPYRQQLEKEILCVLRNHSLASKTKKRLKSALGIISVVESCAEIEGLLNEANDALIDYDSVFPSDIKLVDVNLSYCGITRITPNMIEALLQHQSTIKLFSASDNFLQALPDAIGCLQMVVAFDFENNLLTTVPDALTLCTKVMSLKLEGNLITELPREMGQLKSLRFLMLENNQLSSLPKSLGEVDELRLITLDNNPIESPKKIARQLGLVRTDFTQYALEKKSTRQSPLSKNLPVEHPSEQDWDLTQEEQTVLDSNESFTVDKLKSLLSQLTVNADAPNTGEVRLGTTSAEPSPVLLRKKPANAQQTSNCTASQEQSSPSPKMRKLKPNNN